MLTHELDTHVDADLLWKLNFELAEHYLYSKMSQKDKQTFYLLQILLSGSRLFQQQEVLQSFLCHTFLWFLEQEVSVHSKDETQDIVENAHKLLRTLQDQLKQGISPHYFIPKCNILSDIPRKTCKSVIHYISQTLENFQSVIISTRYLPIQMYSKSKYCNIQDISKDKDSFQTWLSTFEKSVKLMLKRCLLQTFDEIVQLLMVTSHAKLHNHTLDRSILRHKQVMKILLKDPIKLRHIFSLSNLDGNRSNRDARNAGVDEKYINPFLQVLQVSGTISFHHAHC